MAASAVCFLLWVGSPDATRAPSGLQSTAYTYTHHMTQRDIEGRLSLLVPLPSLPPTLRVRVRARLTSSAWPGRSSRSMRFKMSHTYKCIPMPCTRLAFFCCAGRG